MLGLEGDLWTYTSVLGEMTQRWQGNPATFLYHDDVVRLGHDCETKQPVSVQFPLNKVLKTQWPVHPHPKEEKRSGDKAESGRSQSPPPLVQILPLQTQAGVCCGRARSQ